MRWLLVALALVVMASAVGCGPPETVIAPPAETNPSPSPPPQPTTTAGVIKDLAYIKAYSSFYTDDADPEYEGIGVNIVYYDSKSESIYFQNIPIVVTIELYGFQDALDAVNQENIKLIYKTQVTVDRSSYEWGDDVRIPFENIIVDRNEYYRIGTMKVMVITPEQGDFECIEDWMGLYPEE